MLQRIAVALADGSVGWLCVPALNPSEELIATRRAYRKGTLILETEFETAGGCVRLVDYMPPRQRGADLLRVVQGVRGRVKMKMRLIVRFKPEQMRDVALYFESLPSTQAASADSPP